MSIEEITFFQLIGIGILIKAGFLICDFLFYLFIYAFKK